MFTLLMDEFMWTPQSPSPKAPNIDTYLLTYLGPV